jgi:hypothetical protein
MEKIYRHGGHLTKLMRNPYFLPRLHQRRKTRLELCDIRWQLRVLHGGASLRFVLSTSGSVSHDRFQMKIHRFHLCGTEIQCCGASGLHFLKGRKQLEKILLSPARGAGAHAQMHCDAAYSTAGLENALRCG